MHKDNRAFQKLRLREGRKRENGGGYLFENGENRRGSVYKVHGTRVTCGDQQTETLSRLASSRFRRLRRIGRFCPRENGKRISAVSWNVQLAKGKPVHLNENNRALQRRRLMLRPSVPPSLTFRSDNKF